MSFFKENIASYQVINSSILKAFEKSYFHRSIKIKFNFKYPKYNNFISKTTTLCNNFKADWKKFDLELQKIIQNINETDIEELDNKIHQAISSAAEKTIPKKKVVQSTQIKLPIFILKLMKLGK